MKQLNNVELDTVAGGFDASEQIATHAGGAIGGILGGAACSEFPVAVPLCVTAGTMAGEVAGGMIHDAVR